MRETDTAMPARDCPHCSTNPALNDGSLGLKWIIGGVVQSAPCGCTIEGRGVCGFPLHIHFCEAHKRVKTAKRGTDGKLWVKMGRGS